MSGGSAASRTPHETQGAFAFALSLHNGRNDQEPTDLLVSKVVGHLNKGVTEPVLARAIEYWRKID